MIRLLIKKKLLIITFLFSIGVFCGVYTAQAAVPTKSIGFQGQLSNGGSAVNATVAATFEFYDAISGGTLQGSIISKSVNVVNGYFSTSFSEADLVGIDFNQALWVQVTIEGNILAPRSTINTVPFAINSFGLFAYASAPTVGPAGSLYYNTVSNKIFSSDGVSWIDTTGGTTTLAVAQNALVVGNASSTNGEVAPGSVGQILVVNASGTPAWSSGLTVLANGNVGIGTTTPDQKLSVAGNINLTTGGSIYGDTTNPHITLNNSSGALFGYGTSEYRAGGSQLQLYTGGSERVRVDGSGNVGIGTTSPRYTADIWGTLVGDQVAARSTTSNNYVALIPSLTTNTGINKIVSGANSGNLPLAFYGGALNGGDNFSGSVTPLYLYMTNDSTSGSQAAVGINTTNPNASLEIYKSLGSTALFKLSSTSTGDLFTVTNAGNVGIGTASPSTKLHISGTGQSFILNGGGTGAIYGQVGNNGGQYYFGVDSSSGGNLFVDGLAYAAAFGSGNSTALQLATNNTVRMTVSSDGNVGIGTTNPLAKFHVNGPIYSQSSSDTINIGQVSGNTNYSFVGSSGYWGIRNNTSNNAFSLDTYNSNNPINALTVLQNGKVGIGTANPTVPLEVGATGITNLAKIRLNDSTDNQQLIFANGGGDRFIISQGGTILQFASQSTGASGVGQSFLFQGGTPDTLHQGSLFKLTGAYNNAGQSIDGLLVDITNTSSAATSSLFNLKSNGLSKFIVDVSGNVGIGATDPATKLDIVTGLGTGNGVDANTFRIRTSDVNGNAMALMMGVNTTGVGGLNHGYGFLQIHHTGGSQANPLILQPIAGGVSVGQARNYAPLDVQGTIMARPTANTAGAEAGKYGFNFYQYGNGNTPAYIAAVNEGNIYSGLGLVFGTANNGSDVSSTDGTERMRITSTGNIGIGTTTPIFPLDVYASTTSNQTYGYLNSAGEIGTSAGTNAYSIRAQGRILAQEFNAVSDARLKNVQFELDSKLALSLITKLQPVSFTWKTQPDGQPVIGFLAQDVETVIPNAVSKIATDQFPDQRELDYNQVTTVLVGAFKEIAQAVENIGKWFVGGKFNIQDDVCVDDVCLTKDEFKTMLLKSKSEHNTPAPSNNPAVVVPPAEDPAPESEPVPEPTPEPTPEPAPEPEPAPAPVVDTPTE